MKREVQLVPEDEIERIREAASANAYGFEELADSKDYEAVRSFFTGTRDLLKSLDEQMRDLCLRWDDQGRLRLWAGRMESIIIHLDNIERHLPLCRTRLFDWNSVINSMGWLLAYRVGVEQTLAYNAILEKEPETAL